MELPAPHPSEVQAPPLQEAATSAITTEAKIATPNVKALHVTLTGFDDVL